jgi:ankyrin repeat protein
MTESFLASLPEDQRSTFIEGVFDLARTGRTAELREMIESGVPIDVSNARGDTLLIVAAYAQQPEAVSALLALGAPKDAVNQMGQTAISCVVFRNDPAILDLLLEAGADPDAGAHTALAIAQQFGITDMVELLSR